MRSRLLSFTSPGTKYSVSHTTGQLGDRGRSPVSSRSSADEKKLTTPHAHSEVTALGINLRRRRRWSGAVPWELAGTTLQSPGKVSLFSIIFPSTRIKGLRKHQGVPGHRSRGGGGDHNSSIPPAGPSTERQPHQHCLSLPKTAGLAAPAPRSYPCRLRSPRARTAAASRGSELAASRAAGGPGDPARPTEWRESASPGAAPLPYLALLGPGWGIRRVRAAPSSLRTWPPGPAQPCRRASASWRTGAGPGPGLRVQLAAAPAVPSALAARQWLSTSPPRVRAPFLRSLGPAKLVSPLRVVPLVSLRLRRDRAAGLGLGAGPAIRPPSRLSGAERTAPAPTYPLCWSRGRWTPRPFPSVPLRLIYPRPGCLGAMAPPALPAPRPRHFPVALRRPGCCQGSVTAPARKAGEAAARPGPELPRASLQFQSLDELLQLSGSSKDVGVASVGDPPKDCLGDFSRTATDLRFYFIEEAGLYEEASGLEEDLLTT
ncbi:transcription initiation factor TFIID subunit 4-like [Elephas maximus indicus]|uniref:transcription initiation factor TFIID subunit 4-like n=1 Tax=Elephas maximus indicus TaxID=99487 RepID=UPI002115F540|nr:transcription initiation factor TFIID subunit 4-like [Elephas maximus indicus]